MSTIKALEESLYFMYGVSLFIWIIICVVLELYITDPLGILLLFVPVIVIIINIIHIPSTVFQPEVIINADFRTISVLLLVPLLTLMIKKHGTYVYQESKLVRILLTAVILTIISTMDIVVAKPWNLLVQHIQSMLQTLAGGLIIIGLYSISYLYETHKIE